MAKFIEDFKEFAFKGNVMDMAVGVIIGGAFGKIALNGKFLEFFEKSHSDDV